MEELILLLKDIRSDVDFRTETRLIDGGVLDSLDIVWLITALSENYGVVITSRDLTPKNFNSAEAIFALIRRLTDESRA